MDENRKGPGIFYAVVGVATLVVAIIGATFAFFSASDTSIRITFTSIRNIPYYSHARRVCQMFFHSLRVK